MTETMMAATYYGAEDVRFEERPKPQIIDPTDAVIRIEKTTICGTDLGIYHGKNPEIEEVARQKTGEWKGRILGHEGIGVIEEVGANVKNFKPGDRVVISCVSKCGSCPNCQKQLYAHCTGGGSWIMGYMIDGTLAEYVRTPFADNSLLPLPESLDTDIAVFLSDALPTGHEIGVQSADVRPGDDIAIVGAGPVGMGALITAQLYSPASITVIDMNETRLKLAKEMGADYVINPAKEDVEARIKEITDGRMVDGALEAVGLPPTWATCEKIVKPGGNIAVLGVHGKPVTFNLQDSWIKNLTITTGLVKTDSTPMLMKAVSKTDVPMTKLATHHFKFSEFEKAWDTFLNADEHQAMKVMLDNS
ncbi:zinc-dependent alcohol dehydrogenase family protein [Corynebacterium caspium]|uniref:zinc-dependent alcohol dehydrogenase family protein n=1 Tax=Corynebacterium caspium TaxID=234828 RepID=UPI000367A0F4|nr:zinc-dependent alcohol dehydrogenase family protein [Corynebacterium caspium]WKD59235.1 putative zinc-type alcohol dehydrogenase-like protein YjmD [Corynebacterium caspium DSM 44850]